MLVANHLPEGDGDLNYIEPFLSHMNYIEPLLSYLNYIEPFFITYELYRVTNGIIKYFH